VDGAAPIWNKVMTKIHQGSKIENFKKPKGISEAWVSPYTGKPANYKGFPNILEYYLPKTEPKTDQKFDYLDQFKYRR
ncbi:MAG: hypothetical protein PHT36_00455, partial [Patescibacteria group bacterium]|nr:hypothetical protein [Patescibacteria group bacterium]